MSETTTYTLTYISKFTKDPYSTYTAWDILIKSQPNANGFLEKILELGLDKYVFQIHQQIPNDIGNVFKIGQFEQIIRENELYKKSFQKMQSAFNYMGDVVKISEFINRDNHINFEKEKSDLDNGASYAEYDKFLKKIDQ